MSSDSLEGASSYSKTVIPNILLKQERSSSKPKTGKVLTSQVIHLIQIQLNIHFIC
uniref:Uncharacterized protein n=1 Tax=Anguilla anguilla TaxID=7936 RepID=A0A0E9RVK5_ANGAN